MNEKEKENIMSTIESLKNRRSYYAINKEMPVSAEVVKETIRETVRLVPDAFNMKRARVIVA